VSSEPISVRIDYDAPVSFGNIDRVLSAFKQSIGENWGTAPSLSPVYYHGVETSDATTTQILVELSKPNSALGTAAYDHVGGELCPLSCEVAELALWNWFELDELTSWLDVREDIMFEVEGSRELERMEREWMRELERRGKIANADTWPFEHPTEEDLGEDGYDAWWKRYFDLRDKTPSVWPRNRQCFLNIVEHLKRALPVKNVELDPRLREDGAKS
jgi:hypothetical protein